jgi:hypothetical protein
MPAGRNKRTYRAIERGVRFMSRRDLLAVLRILSRAAKKTATIVIIIVASAA